MNLNSATLKEQLAAVQKYGYAIKQINNPSLEVQMAAVQENSYTIQHIENPSDYVKFLDNLLIGA